MCFYLPLSFSNYFYFYFYFYFYLDFYILVFIYLFNYYLLDNTTKFICLNFILVFVVEVGLLSRSILPSRLLSWYFDLYMNRLYSVYFNIDFCKYFALSYIFFILYCGYFGGYFDFFGFFSVVGRCTIHDYPYLSWLRS